MPQSHYVMAIMTRMKRASVTEAKNSLSALIDSVKGGSSVLIMDRGRPVARLEPVGAVAGADGERLPRLVREGIVRPARRATDTSLFRSPPPPTTDDVSAVRMLLDERREGR
jgi:prevent-host-death family protein